MAAIFRQISRLRTNAYKNRHIAFGKAEVAGKSKETSRDLMMNHKIVVFMNGSPQAPQCAYSNAVARILRMHEVQYVYLDVWQNQNLRQAIKTYTHWPIVPQVFIDGEFVGDGDILVEMHQNGDLIKRLKEAGIVSQLANALPKPIKKQTETETETEPQ